MAHATRAFAHIALLAILSLLAGAGEGCEAVQPGSFTLSIVWDTPPVSTVQVWTRVEERSDPSQPGRILASAGPEEHRPGGTTILRMPSVASGKQRHVVVEVREGPNPGLRVLYYGISAPFELKAGVHQTVEVPLRLQAPASDRRIAASPLELLFDGAPRRAVSRSGMRRATVRTRSTGAVQVVLANDASFSAGLQTFPLRDGDRVLCTEEPAGEDGEEPWTVCDIGPWDLGAGLPSEADGLFFVYAKLVDDRGYDSAVHRASVMVDGSGPMVLGASLSTAIAGSGAEVFLTVSVHEELGRESEAVKLRLEPSLGAPSFSGPQRLGETTSYVWRASVESQAAEGPYTFWLRAADALGNASEEQQLPGEGGGALILRVDRTLPALAGAVELRQGGEAVAGREALFGPADPARPEAGRLGLRFILQEDNPPPLPGVVGPCAEGCPEVRVAGRRLGVTQRVPELDDPALGWLGFGYELEVLAGDWGGLQRAVDFNVRWSDAAGNLAEIELDLPVRFDFAAPDVVDARVVPELAAPGSRVQVSLTVDEPLAAGFPRLRTEPEAPFEPAAGSGSRWSFTTTVDAGFAADEYRFFVDLADAAGNQASLPLQGAAGLPLVLAVDLRPPEIAAGSVTLGRTLFAHGEVLDFEFEVWEARPSAELPRVLVGGNPVGAVELEDEPGPELRRYRFRYGVDAGDFGRQGGVQRIVVEQSDGAGNRMVDRDSVPQVTFDFHGPRVLEARVAPELAASGSRVQVSLTVDETLAADFPRLRVVPEAPFGPAVGSGPSWSFAATVDESFAAGEYRFFVDLADAAGNHSSGVALESSAGVPLLLGVDRAPPEIVAGSVVLEQTLFAHGEVVDLGFVVREVRPAVELPRVLVGGNPLGAVVLEGEPGPELRRYRFRYAVDEDDPGVQEGVQRIVVEQSDAAGNQMADRESVPRVTFDFHGPRVLDARVSPSLAMFGSRVQVSLTLDEPPAEGSPRLRVVPEVPFGSAAGAGLSWSFAATVDDAFTAEEYRFFVDLVDPAGNAALGVALESSPGEPLLLEVDLRPPEIVAGSVALEQTLYAHGDWVDFTFDVREARPGGELPLVTLGGDPVGEVTLEGAPESEVWRYRYLYRVDEEDFGGQDGPKRIVVEQADLAGNLLVDQSSVPAVRLDFHGPKVVSSAIYLEPGPDNLLRQVDALRPGTLLVVAFGTDEPVAGEPWVRLVDGEGEPLLTLDPVEIGETAFTFEASLTPEVAIRDGEYGLVADLSDRAGNPTRAALLGEVAIDDTAPAPPDPEKLIYRRAPWGAKDSWRNEPEYSVRGEPGAVDPGVPVFVFDGQNEARSVIGQGAADGEGGIEPILLQRADRRAVYLAAADGAGNLSWPVAVSRVEWVATLGQKVPGSTFENPTVFSTTGYLRPTSFQAEEATREPTRAELARLVAEGEGRVVERAGEGRWSRIKSTSFYSQGFSSGQVAFDSLRGRILMVGDWGDREQFLFQWHSAAQAGWPFLTTNSPPIREAAALVFDPRRDRAVLFGGRRDGDLASDLWEFDGTAAAWEERTAVGGRWPAAREWHAAAYDGSRGKVVLFGGGDASGRDLLADTWEWDGDGWVERTPDPAQPGPVPRFRHALAYDGTRGRVVLFGGWTEAGDPLADLWEWDGEAGVWIDRTPPILPEAWPAPRGGHGMTYDERRQTVVLFGGGLLDPAKDFECADVSRRNDLWEWDGERGTWTDRTVPGIVWPGERCAHSLLHDRSSGEVVVVDWAPWDWRVWEWSWETGAWANQSWCGNALWSSEDQCLAYSPMTGSVGRWNAAVAYNPENGTVTVAGGQEWSTEELRPERAGTDCDDGVSGGGDRVGGSGLLPRARLVGAYDRGRGRWVVGRPDLYDSDVWEWDCCDAGGGGRFEPRGGGERPDQALLYHDAAGRVLQLKLAGTVAQPAAAVWEWDCCDADGRGRWVERVAGKLRDGAGFRAAAFDPSRCQVVLLGGDDHRFRTWEWDHPTGQLVDRTPTEVPPVWPVPGSPGRLAFDRRRNRVMLLGGTDGPAAFGAQGQHLWEWDCCDGTGKGSWTLRTPVPAPATWPAWRSEPGFAFDDTQGALVLFGGADESGDRHDLWEWDGARAAWTDRTPSPLPAEWPALGRGVVLGFDSRRGTLGLLAAQPRRAHRAVDSWDVWAYEARDWDGRSGTWTDRLGQPSGRNHHALAFDPGTGGMVVFGGRWDERTEPLDDAWQWSCCEPSGHGSWASRTPVPRPESWPAARLGHAMVPDEQRGTVLLFGGQGDSAGARLFQDIWQWEGASGTWTELALDSSASAPPSPRAFHALAYDEDRGKVVLFGGRSAAGMLQDLWEWDGTDERWIRQEPAGALPEPRFRPAMTFHGGRRAVVLAGGFKREPTHDNDDDARSRERWEWIGGGRERPAALWTLPLVATGDSGDTLDEVVLRVVAGGRGHTLGASAVAVDGVEVLAWDVVVGGWVTEGTSAAAPEEPAAVSIRWDDPVRFERLLSGAERLLRVAVAPLQVSGGGVERARIAVDSLELTVSYRRTYTCGSQDCGAHASCVVGPQGPTCACDLGYSGDGVFCDDVDECAEQTHDCRPGEVCLNTAGEYLCLCAPGHVRSGELCLDLDECLTGLHRCSVLATCTNLPGSYRCACQEGYQGDGRTCRDIDECAAGTHDCREDEVCRNTPGGYDCDCAPGFLLDGAVCRDLDECDAGVHACDVNARCENTIGSYQCTCNPGFGPEGDACVDLDECALGTHDCDAQAACGNTLGAWSCWCRAGFTGDGKVCLPTTFLALETGGGHACAVQQDGILACWGRNSKGELGAGPPTPRESPTVVGPLRFRWWGVPVREASAGYSHSCAVLADGSLWCWGGNELGQFGDGTTEDQHWPVRAGTWKDWAFVAAGFRHGCGIRAEGTLWCWGYNNEYQLGDGTRSSRLLPVRVADLAQWQAATAGYTHTCGIRSDGSLWCWGGNDGRIGDGTTGMRPVPVQVGGWTDWSRITAGQTHTCGLRSDGGLWCWGVNASGELGDGTMTKRTAPVRIGAATDWTTVSAGSQHTCGVRGNGSLWCWGLNSLGQLGDGTTTTRLTPVRIGALDGWATVSAGHSHTCALRDDGSIWCWGDNGEGQLGDDGAGSETPVRVGP